jgi:hypothetical protein
MVWATCDDCRKQLDQLTEAGGGLMEQSVHMRASLDTCATLTNALKSHFF